MCLNFLFKNPLSPLKRLLISYGFSDLTDLVKSNKNFRGMKPVALSNGKIVFVLLDSFHDQQIYIYFCEYPYSEDKLKDIEELIFKLDLKTQFDYPGITSYDKSTREHAVEKISVLLEKLVNSLSFETNTNKKIIV